MFTQTIKTISVSRKESCMIKEKKYVYLSNHANQLVKGNLFFICQGLPIEYMDIL